MADLVDTHAIVWFLTAGPSLSERARLAISSAITSGHSIFIPAICLVELTYLVEKGRLAPDVRETVLSALDASNTPLTLMSLDRSITNALPLISRDQVPDMPDRIIAATVLALHLPLVTRDNRIRAASIQTLW